MAIPEFNEIKAPALQFFADGKPHRIPEVYGVLASGFQLTPDDLAEMLPSGTQSRWENRANWACYDLFRAGLLDRPKRAVYVISEQGQKVAAEKPKIIDRSFLAKFPRFREWLDSTAVKRGQRADEGSPAPTVTVVEPLGGTPEERMGDAHQELVSDLKRDVLAIVKKMDPKFFERLVLDLLIAMGYGGSREEAAQMTKASNDEGIDGVINEDRLGLDVIYIQAKRWQEAVGRKEIQSFVGALSGKRAHKGVFITTSAFSHAASAYVRDIQAKVILIDGDRLADLMIQHNVGVSRKHAYEIKQVDSDYFDLD